MAGGPTQAIKGSISEGTECSSAVVGVAPRPTQQCYKGVNTLTRHCGIRNQHVVEPKGKRRRLSRPSSSRQAARGADEASVPSDGLHAQDGLHADCRRLLELTR